MSIFGNPEHKHLTLDDKFRNRYKYLNAFDRALRVMRKIFYRRWYLTYGTQYQESRANGATIIDNTFYVYQKNDIIMTKIAAGRSVEWDYFTMADILLNFPWENVPLDELESQNTLIKYLATEQYQGFYKVNDIKSPQKDRPCNSGCRHLENFGNWGYTGRVLNVTVDDIVKLDSTMTKQDWTKYIQAMAQDSDNYEPKRIYPDLDQMEQSLNLKKEATDQMTKGNYILAIHFLNLAIDIRGVTENHLASLYLARAKCWLQWIEKQNCRQQKYAKRAKKDIERALYIRPNFAESWSTMGHCFDALKEWKKAAYFHQMSIDLSKGKKCYIKAKQDSENKSKIKEPDWGMEPHQIMSLGAGNAFGGILNKYQMDQFLEMAHVEAEEYRHIMRAVEADGSKLKRDHYEESIKKWSPNDLHPFQKGQLDSNKAGAIYTISVTDKTKFAEPYTGLANILLKNQKTNLGKEINIEKTACQLYENASNLLYTNKYGYRINYGKSEACYKYAKLILKSNPALAEKLLLKAIENFDGKHSLYSALYRLGLLYLNGGGIDDDSVPQENKVAKDIEKGIFVLTESSNVGSVKATKSLYDYFILVNGGEISPKTKDWEARVQNPPRFKVEVPFTFSNFNSKHKTIKSGKENSLIKQFRELLVKNNKVNISKNENYSNLETFYPAESHTGVPISQYKIVSQASFDYEDPNDINSVMRKMMPGMTMQYPKCVLEGTLREEPLVGDGHIEILLDDVTFYPVRAVVINGDPSKFIIGTRYSLVALQTCKSKFDGAAIHSSEWIIKGPRNPNSCRNCSKPAKLVQCDNCSANYCDKVCQQLDMKNGHNLICRLKSIKQRISK